MIAVAAVLSGAPCMPPQSFRGHTYVVSNDGLCHCCSYDEERISMLYTCLHRSFETGFHFFRILNTIHNTAFKTQWSLFQKPFGELQVFRGRSVICRKWIMRVMFSMKLFYKIVNQVEGWELAYGFADLVRGFADWATGFRNCVTHVKILCVSSCTVDVMVANVISVLLLW